MTEEKRHITAVWRNGGFSASYDKIRHYAKPQTVVRHFKNRNH